MNTPERQDAVARRHLLQNAIDELSEIKSTAANQAELEEVAQRRAYQASLSKMSMVELSATNTAAMRREFAELNNLPHFNEHNDAL